MVEIGEEFFLVYPPANEREECIRVRVKVLCRETDGGSFDVEDVANPGDAWTVFQREVDEGVVGIVRADPLFDDCADEFSALIGDLEFEDPDVHVPDYSGMSRAQLTDEWLRVKDKLTDAGHLFVQHTEEEKDLRTQYDRLMMEMRRRDEKK